MQYYKQQLVFSTGTWIPFSPVIACDQIVFRNVSSEVVNFCTNPSDPTTMDDLNPGDQEVIPSVVKHVGGNVVFQNDGTVVAYFQATTNTATIMATLFQD